MDEATLIAAARDGDARAFEELVRAYQGRVYNLAYRVLGDGEAAADATQDAFLHAYRALRSFRGGSFKGWLLRIVTNSCYDQLRHRQRRPALSLEELMASEESEIEFRDPGRAPEEEVMGRELEQVIQAGIDSLPPEQRVILVMADIQGLSYEEIAHITQTQLGTVKSRLSRGRSALRDYLLAHGELLPQRYRLKVGS